MGFLALENIRQPRAWSVVCEACKAGDHAQCCARQLQPCACRDAACMAQGTQGRQMVQQNLFNTKRKGGR